MLGLPLLLTLPAERHLVELDVAHGLGLLPWQVTSVVSLRGLAVVWLHGLAVVSF